MKALLPALILAGTLTTAAQVPRVSHGTVHRLDRFPSAFVQPRTVDVWLPEGYDTTRAYAVLYMHDGLGLFDSTLITKREEWGVDETVTALTASGAIRGCIVVGIAHTGDFRHTEYFPAKSLAYVPQPLRDTLIARELNGAPLGDRYLSFLVRELKPFIDAHFATRRDRANTFIAGSSMGGLISWYALCEYPEVFGGAACLSTHWVGSTARGRDTVAAAFNEYLIHHLPPPATHRMYFDHGTAGLDSLYGPYQGWVDRTMRAAGYDATTWMTRVWPGADHTESAWQRRLSVPLTFLLGPR
jgi:enterochelin esterase-like enzyme